MQESVQQFLREFDRVKKDYRFIDLNIVAVRWTNYWLNICTRVTLLTDITQRRRINVPKDLPDNLKIVSAVLPIDDLEKILNIFEFGYLNFLMENYWLLSLRFPHQNQLSRFIRTSV